MGGLVSLRYGLLHVHPWHPAQFVTLLVLAILAARLKLKLPELHGNMSVYSALHPDRDSGVEPVRGANDCLGLDLRTVLSEGWRQAQSGTDTV
jgi:hypothetical protein